MLVKICGLSDPRDVAAAIQGGARYLGFVHFPKSPRHVSLDRARDLMLAVPEGICKVVLTVDADDALLTAITAKLPVDMLQLHGHETADRVAGIRARTGLPVMKAVGVASADDLAALETYARVADQLLVDAKPPKTAELPGGNGLTFDWRLIASFDEILTLTAGLQASRGDALVQALRDVKMKVLEFEKIFNERKYVIMEVI